MEVLSVQKQYDRHGRYDGHDPVDLHGPGRFGIDRGHDSRDPAAQRPFQAQMAWMHSIDLDHLSP